jgi:protein-tyrosine sulfotransferase
MRASVLRLRTVLGRARAQAARLKERWRFADGLLAGSRWPVRAKDSERPPPFFVLGSPRSGTTLLRAILCAHPDVYIPPENGALGRMILTFGRERSSPWDDVVDKVLGEFAGGYEYEYWGTDIEAVKRQAKGLSEPDRSLAALFELLYTEYGRRTAPTKHIWGDKTTPGNFRFIRKVALAFPNARYVHIVRDGRDCVTSSVRAGFFSESYQNAAHAWRDNVRTCRRFGRSVKGRFHELRYEDLVRAPRDQIALLCSFLRIDPAPSMLEHQSLVAESTPDVGEIAHHANVTRPISTQSLGKWQRELPESEREAVMEILAVELERCGYTQGGGVV